MSWPLGWCQPPSFLSAPFISRAQKYNAWSGCQFPRVCAVLSTPYTGASPVQAECLSGFPLTNARSEPRDPGSVRGENGRPGPVADLGRRLSPTQAGCRLWALTSCVRPRSPSSSWLLRVFITKRHGPRQVPATETACSPVFTDTVSQAARAERCVSGRVPEPRHEPRRTLPDVARQPGAEDFGFCAGLVLCHLGLALPSE